MLYGMKMDETSKTIKLLEESPFVFHLTGSRKFGNARSTSDWDFFVEEGEYADTVERWLSANGFQKDSYSRYKTGRNTAAVWKKGMVHIQIVHNAETKLEVEEILLKNGILLHSWSKPELREIWALVYDAVEMTEQRLARKRSESIEEAVQNSDYSMMMT